MTGEMTLSSPLTEEQWDAITDVDFDQTDSIWFETKHVKRVEFVKRKTGKWMPCPNRGWGEIWECSHCGEETTSSIMGEPRYRFCPMCGYEMLNGGEPE